jgi:hypothetical protein
LTYDGKGKARVFLNAKEYLPYNINISSGVRVSRDLYIGAESVNSLVNGMMDEVRIYDSYITLAEVQKHYAEGLFRVGLASYANK